MTWQKMKIKTKLWPTHYGRQHNLITFTYYIFISIKHFYFFECYFLFIATKVFRIFGFV